MIGVDGAGVKLQTMLFSNLAAALAVGEEKGFNQGQAAGPQQILLVLLQHIKKARGLPYQAASCAARFDP